MNEQERMVRLTIDEADTKRKLKGDLQQVAAALMHTDNISGFEDLKNDALDLQKKINAFLKKVK